MRILLLLICAALSGCATADRTRSAEQRKRERAQARAVRELYWQLQQDQQRPASPLQP
jgi:uncharacterized protein YceK